MMCAFISKNFKTIVICVALAISSFFLNFSVYHSSNLKKPVIIENTTKKLISILESLYSWLIQPLMLKNYINFKPTIL